MSRTARAIAPPLLLGIAFLALWQLAIFLWSVPEFLLPSPMAVALALYEKSWPLAVATPRTAFSTVSGFLIAALLGIGVGSTLGLSRWAERAFYPPTLLLQMVPLVAIAPLFVVWFGFGARSTIAATVVVALFPVIANTLDGIRNTDPDLRELFALYGAGRLEIWWKLELPSATPAIFTGLRISAGLAVIGAITAEFVSGYTGDDAPLGALILGSIKTFRTDLMFAAIAIASCVGFLLFGLVNALGWIFLHRWQEVRQ